jgi:hypothetical protein
MIANAVLLVASVYLIFMPECVSWLKFRGHSRASLAAVWVAFAACVYVIGVVFATVMR